MQPVYVGNQAYVATVRGRTEHGDAYQWLADQKLSAMAMTKVGILNYDFSRHVGILNDFEQFNTAKPPSQMPDIILLECRDPVTQAVVDYRLKIGKDLHRVGADVAFLMALSKAHQSDRDALIPVWNIKIQPSGSIFDLLDLDWKWCNLNDQLEIQEDVIPTPPAAPKENIPVPQAVAGDEDDDVEDKLVVARWETEECMDATFDRCTDPDRPTVSEAWAYLHSLDPLGKAWMEDRDVPVPDDLKIDFGKLKQFCPAPRERDQKTLRAVYRTTQNGRTVDFHITIGNDEFSIGREAAGLLKNLKALNSKDEEAISLPTYPIDPLTELRKVGTLPTFRWMRIDTHFYVRDNPILSHRQRLPLPPPDGPAPENISSAEGAEMALYGVVGATAAGALAYGLYRLPPVRLPRLPGIRFWRKAAA